LIDRVGKGIPAIGNRQLYIVDTPNDLIAPKALSAMLDILDIL